LGGGAVPSQELLITRQVIIQKKEAKEAVVAQRYAFKELCGCIYANSFNMTPAQLLFQGTFGSESIAPTAFTQLFVVATRAKTNSGRSVNRQPFVPVQKIFTLSLFKYWVYL